MRKFFFSLFFIVFHFFASAQPGTLDATFNPGTGADNQIYSLIQQPDGKIIIGGDFTTYNGTARTRIARLNSDGSLDASFNPGSGTDNYVLSMARQPDGKILIAGFFTNYNGTARNRVARLNSDGTLDASFNPGSGANNVVYSIVVQPDGKILIGGIFTTYNGTARNRIARLNTDGSLDASFGPGSGANQVVYPIVVQPDGKILIGGEFTTYNGTARNRIARLNNDGSLDASFNPGSGANDYVYAMFPQPDGKILIGGPFTTYNGTGKNHIARLNTDGSLDASFSGSGTDGGVFYVIRQSDGKILIGGDFFSYNGTGRNLLARLNADGSLDPSFDPGAGPNNLGIYSMIQQPDGKILIGGVFTTYDGTSINRIARINNGATTMISTSALAVASLCAGGTVSVPFTATGSFVAGNILTAQLSDATGSFAAPLAIGTLSGTASGTVTATIPAIAAGGTGYRIRVISSNPAVTGTDNGSNLQIIKIATTGAHINASCFGSSNGSAAVTPAGGITPYSYSWSPSGGSGTTASGLSSGDYTVIVTDNIGCQATRDFTIIQPAAISITPASQTNVSCSGGSNGAASVNTPTGGTGSYTYNWTPGNPTGDGTASVTGLTAGIWTCTVTDANGCTATQSFTITANPIPDVTASPLSQTVSSGSAISTISLSGTVSGTTYNWTRNNTTDVTGIAASGSGDISGTLTNTTNAPVTVSFTITPTANGCDGTAVTAIVIVYPIPTVDAISDQVVCNNGTTTAINFTGLVAGTNYSWTNNNPAIGLAAGGTGNIASFTATNGGTSSATATITVTPTLVSNTLIPEILYYKFNGTGTTVTNLASAPPAGTSVATIQGGLSQGGSGICNGSLVGTGITSNTDYLNTGWNTQLTSSWTISFKTSGITPSVTLFYIFGDITANSFRCFTNGVAGPDNWILRGGGMTDVLVPGAATIAPHTTTFVYDAIAGNIKAYLDGVLVNTVSQPPLSIIGTDPFKVSGYSSTVGLPAGGLMDEFSIYSRALSSTEVQVLSGGCNNPSVTSTGTSQTFTITVNPTPVAIATPAAQTVCSGAAISTIGLTSTTSGTTYSWTRDNTVSVTGIAASGTGDISGTLTNTTNAPVTVSFTVIPTADGCAGTPVIATVIVPVSLVATANGQTNVTCNGGSNGLATVSVAGGTGAYTYSWSPSGGSAATASGLTAGDYTVTVTDANTCSTTQSFTITQPAAVAISSVTVPANGTYTGGNNLDFTVNYNQNVIVNTTGGTPYITLTLNTGGTRQASYVSGSGTSSLVFRHTLTATDQDADGISVGGNITLNGGTIKNSTGCDALSVLNGLPSTAGIRVHNPVAQTITFGVIPAKTYGDPDFDISATTTSGLSLVYTSSNTAVATIIAGKIHIVGAGSSIITATQAGDANYLPAIAVAQTLAVNAKAVTVTAAAKTKTYGDADPSLTYTVSPALISGDAFTGSLSRAAGENISAYAINQNTLALNANYTLTYAGADLTITKKAVTVTADAKTKTYGDADPALTYTVSPALVSGDAFTGSLSHAAGEGVGAYAINQNTLALNNNYVLNYTGADLTITKKAVTVTADAKTKTYGDADPALTYTVSPALISGDVFTGSLSRAAGADVGAYAINQNTLALNANYTLTYTGADLTITKKAVTVTADSKAKTYGDVDPALTYTVSPALISGDAFTGSLSRAAGENIGTYVIIQNTLALNGNYTLTYTGADLAITTKAVTVTADTKTKTYGDADPALTYVVSPALISGDAFTGSLSRTAGEDVDAYAINQNTLALNANYTLTYTGADLTITTKAVTVTAGAKTKTYGDADPVLTYTVSPALISGDAFTGSLSRTAGEDVGAYAINQNTLALNGNYAITYASADLTIGQKAVAVTADAKSKTYGDAEPALTYTVLPALISGDVFTGSLSRAAGEDVGAYAINQNTLALNNNYVLNYTGADLTITKKAVTVTAGAKTKTYGDADPALTYTVSPALISGDAFTGSLSRAAGEGVGAYAINQNTLALNNNYVLNYTGADLTITKKAVTVTADAKTKIYGNSDPALTYTVSPALISGDAFTGELDRTAGENIGAYAINQHTLALNDNYTITYVSADLTITKKAVTVTADAKTKTYGNADPAFTYTVSPALLSGDVFTGVLSRTAGENAGTYPINQGSLNNNNYAIGFVSAALTINKAAQQITWTQTLITGCDGNTSIALAATASSGLPVGYQSANTAVATVSGTQLLIAGPGTSMITASQAGNNNYLPAADVPNELLSKLPANLLVKRWDDVLVFDNSSKQYTAWQWYKNGAIINGASGQYYYESSKLNGDYYAVVKTVTGTSLQTCAVTITPGSVFIPLSVTPNPVDPGQTVIARTSYTAAQLQGANIVVSNVMGVVVQTIQNVTPQTTISMQHAPGLYVVRLRLANGATASVNVLVKPQ